MPRKLPTACLFICLFFAGFAAFSQSELWKEVTFDRVLAEGTPSISANEALYYEVDFDPLFDRLTNAPQAEGTFIELPMPEGGRMAFELSVNSTMQPGLQSKFPNIRSFDAVSTDGTSARAKIEISPSGLRAAVIRAGGMFYVDPVRIGQNESYIVYARSEFTTDKSLECLVEDGDSVGTESKSGTDYAPCEWNVYRLAMAATGEYTQFHGGTVEAGLAAIVTTVNRVNQVFERDLGVTLSLIENNDLLVYTNAATDPYSNNNAFQMLNQNQSNINSVIGSGNYDVGHVVSTGGGGVAGLGVTCTNAKARGVTGTFNPVGDPFDIDYVAHEMGHQFGARHTFNNSCQGNRSDATAVEPGSGSTIMGYAGICFPNVQNNSDPYFHGISMYEIGLQTAANTCQTIVDTGNSAPVIDDVTGDLFLPVSTPFALTGYAYDDDAEDVLTYAWEQMDNEISTQPPTPAAASGPSFRSILPGESPTRHFPRLSVLASSANYAWEKLPAVSRNMNFRFTVRDNAEDGGCTQYHDATVNFVSEAGPFVVNYPNDPGIEWESFEMQTVTWDVAGTDLPPVNAQFVDIFLSVDGGQSYPLMLTENVPNSGSATIEVPNVSTNQARIMVANAEGTFFDISDNPFTIVGMAEGFVVMTAQTDTSLCIGDELVLDIHVLDVGAFDAPVTLSVINPEPEFQAVLGSEELLPGESTTLTIANTQGALPGEKTVAVMGQSNDLEHTREIHIAFNEPEVSAPSGLTPEDGTEGVPLNVMLAWEATASPDALFRLQLSPEDGEDNWETDTILQVSEFQPAGLEPQTEYRWRVSAFTACDTSEFSAQYSFSTVSCHTFQGMDLPLGMPPVPATVVSSINLPYSGHVANVRLWDIHGTHNRISDLTLSLISPAGTEVELMSQICGTDQDFHVSFDDAATAGPVQCPPTAAQVTSPNQPLSAFFGEPIHGDWQLKIVDSEMGAGGQLLGWTLEICAADGQAFVFSPAQDTLVACSLGAYPVEVAVFGSMNFQESILLEATDLPPGVTADFSPATILPADTAVLTLNVGPSALPGIYDIVVAGIAETEVVEFQLTLLLDDEQPQSATLISPESGSGEVPVFSLFRWSQSGSGTETFDLEFAADPDFASPVDAINDLDTVAYAHAGLPPDETLYWRVRTHNACGSSLSAVSVFSTQNCVLYSPQDLPLLLSGSEATVYTSTIEVPASQPPGHIRVSGLQGIFAPLQNLEARLISPQGEEVLMFAGLCPDDDAVFLNFEDGAPGLIDCPPNLASTHAPSESFSAFSGVDPSGTWTLELVATEGGVEGVLTGWNLEICQSSVAVAEVASTQFQLFPNPTAGKFTVLLAGDSEITHVRISDITGRVLMEIEALQVGEFEVDLTTHPDGVYLIHAIGTVGVSTQKLVKSR